MSKKNKQRKHSPKPEAKATANPANKASKNKAGKNAAGKPSWLNRRNALKLLIAAPIVGVVGAAIHRHDVQNRGLFDLSPLGQGQPMIVQVHDPDCQPCKRLQGNTRKALKELKDREDIVYRVADITTNDGGKFQREYNSGITTLILFNAAGKRVDTIQGVATVDTLKERFSAL